MDEKFCLDEIISIECVDEEDTLDISVSGNNLFFANDILTHNSGLDASDISSTNISDSIGLLMTADLLIGLIVTDELEAQHQMMFKQLKNRYNDVNYYRKFVVGIDKSKMRLFDVDQDQIDYTEEGHKDRKDASVFDASDFGQRAKEDDQMKFVTKKAGRKDFSSLH